MKQIQHEIIEGSNYRTNLGDSPLRLPVLCLLPRRPSRNVQSRRHLLRASAPRHIRAQDLGWRDAPGHFSLRAVDRPGRRRCGQGKPRTSTRLDPFSGISLPGMSGKSVPWCGGFGASENEPPLRPVYTAFFSRLTFAHLSR